MAYSIDVHPAGRRFVAEPGETILAAALRQGVMLAYGCRNGLCGTCKGRLLSGEVGYAEGLPPALTAAEAAAGTVLCCSAVAASDLALQACVVDAVQGIPVRRLPCRVARMTRLAHDVMALQLKLPAGERLQFLAGQYVDVLLRDGGRRGFSLANAPHDDEFLELHVRHVPGGSFSRHVFTEMQERAILRIEGPLGTFFLREASTRPILLMGGGTGFAPLKGIIEHARHIGLDRPMHLYWGVRAARDLYADALARRWCTEIPGFRYTPVLSLPAPEDDWAGRTGFVHTALTADYPELAGHDVYMSGPPPMIAAAKAEFACCGLPADQLYYDSFDYAHPGPLPGPVVAASTDRT